MSVTGTIHATQPAGRTKAPAVPAGRRDGPWLLSVAPMMDWTDRHCRYFHRLLSPHARLYTEMVTAAALVHGDRLHLLEHSHEEHPVALQLGGSDPAALAQAARYGAEAGYDEINLNVGCPSDRVQSGRFGACLMLEPMLVAECVQAMREAVAVPVTVKCRIGVDDQDSEAGLQAFAERMVEAGVRILIVHARKAWLQGLSPKENREVPPLDYDRVYRLARAFPGLSVIINGGIAGVGETLAHMQHVDGVMLGRAAYQHPWILAELEARLWGTPLPSRVAVLRQMRPYIEAERARGVHLRHVVRHMLGLFHGQPGARRFRRVLSEGAHRDGAGWPLVEQAIAALDPAAREAA